MHRSITQHAIHEVFKTEKISLLKRPHTKKDIKHKTANLLIPHAARKVFSKMRIAKESSVVDQLQYLHNEGILGDILNLAMKDEIYSFSQKRSFTRKDENILDNLTAFETDFENPEKAEIFLKRFGHELLNIYSIKRRQS